MATKEYMVPEHLEANTKHGQFHDYNLMALGQHMIIDEKASKKIVRKYDINLLPLFLLINLFSFVDRVNIGNARLLGLSDDLELGVGLRYNTALECLFVTYCLVELPSNILCKKVGGHIWIPTLVITFGIITALTSVVKVRGSLYAIRALLGCAEGGISPGLVWMLSQFYCRKELGFRTAIYISAASASGAFGGLLAIGLSSIPSAGFIHSWRWIFLIEGLISIVTGLSAIFLIPKDPSRARFLSADEKITAVHRLKIDSAGTDEFGRTRPKHVWQAISSPHVLVCGLGFFLANTVIQSFSVFSPSIIKQFGHSAEESQLLSVGPYAVAAIYSIFTGYLSDRYETRSTIILTSAPIGIFGFALLLGLPERNIQGRYGALYFVAIGLYAMAPMWLTWSVNNCATPTVRSAAAGITFTIGSLGGVVAPWIYLGTTSSDYLRGHIILLVFVSGSFMCAAALRLYCQWENKQREIGLRNYRLEGLSEDKAQELSSNHPAFRYIS